MNELPPDPPRLRAILAHLDKQIADTETVATYLRLQRGAVLTAISRTERKAVPRPAPPAPQRPPAPATRRDSGGRPATRYIVERPTSASKTALVHTGDCTKGLTASRPIGADVAREVLTNDPKGFQACDACHPDTELGIGTA